MDVIYPQCCGLDVHKKTIVACLITSTAGAEPMKEIRTFGTMTADLLALADWLQEAGCTHVALESTGVPTVEIATNRGPTSIVMPPRVLFTPHERGKNLGTPGAADLQRAIVLAALQLLEAAREPFTTVDWRPEAAAA